MTTSFAAGSGFVRRLARVEAARGRECPARQ